MIAHSQATSCRSSRRFRNVAPREPGGTARDIFLAPISQHLDDRHHGVRKALPLVPPCHRPIIKLSPAHGPPIIETTAAYRGAKPRMRSIRSSGGQSGSALLAAWLFRLHINCPLWRVSNAATRWVKDYAHDVNAICAAGSRRRGLPQGRDGRAVFPVRPDRAAYCSLSSPDRPTLAQDAGASRYHA